MILDQMKYARVYSGLHTGIDQALEAMARYTKNNYPAGRVELDGDNLFLLLNSYQTHPAADALCEAHRQYIDVMYMVEGEELIYVKPTDLLSAVVKEYDTQTDAVLAKTDADATPVRLTEGCFVILFPQDAHTPACCIEQPQQVKKIIAKVRIKNRQLPDPVTSAPKRR